MAFHSKYKNGRRITSDILVSGYIKQQIQPQLKKNIIPDELYKLCFQYWLHKACDAWNQDFHQDHMIKINGDKIIALYHKSVENANLLLGNHVAVDGSKYHWKIKMNRIGFEPIDKYKHDVNKYESRRRGMIERLNKVRKQIKLMNPTVGIISNNNKILRKCISSNENWAIKEYGYSLTRGTARLIPKAKEQHYVYRAEGYHGDCPKFNNNEDVIEVHLDLVNYTLGYTINDKYCGIAFTGIDTERL